MDTMFEPASNEIKSNYTIEELPDSPKSEKEQQSDNESDEELAYGSARSTEGVSSQRLSNLDINPDSELDNYRRRRFKPTSGNDLKYMTGGDVNIIAYEELLNYNSLEDLLGDNGAAIILYPNPGKINIGHWCCIFLQPGTFPQACQFFDSYGVCVDEELDDYNKDKSNIHKRKKLPPKLIELLLDTPYADHFFYNEYPLQSLEVATNTCGLWCVWRLKNRSLTEDQFKKLFYDIPANSRISPDLAISRLTSLQYPEF